MKWFKSTKEIRPYINNIKEILGDKLKEKVYIKSKCEQYFWRHNLSNGQTCSFTVIIHYGSKNFSIYWCDYGPIRQSDFNRTVYEYLEQLDSEAQEIILFNLSTFNI